MLQAGHIIKAVRVAAEHDYLDEMVKTLDEYGCDIMMRETGVGHRRLGH